MLLHKDDKFLALAKSRGAAISRNDKSVTAIVSYMFKQGVKPCDIAASSLTIRTTVAEGMGKFNLTDKTVDLKPAHNKFTCLELFQDSSKAIDKKIADKKEAKKHCRDVEKKKLFAADIELLQLRKAALKAVDKRLSYEPREWASKLVTLYKKEAKQKALTANKKKAGYTSKDAQEVADELGYNLRQEADAQGLKTKYTQGEQEFCPKAQAEKAKLESQPKVLVWVQQLTNAKHALQKEENPPKNLAALLKQIDDALSQGIKH